MSLESFFDKLTLVQLLFVFLLIVFPGAVAMHIYRRIAPAKEINWHSIITEATFWGTVNAVIVLPLISLPVAILWFCELQLPIISIIIVSFIILVCAAIFLPIVWVGWISKHHIYKRFCVHTIPTAWDYYFIKRKPCFIIIHLKNNNLIGGYYGENSFASSYPEKTSIYLERLIYINADGTFGDPIEDSKGVLLDSDAFDYLEFFEH
jgi:hypothetical protein